MSKYNRSDLEKYVIHYAKWPETRVKRETAIALERILEEGRFPLPPPISSHNQNNRISSNPQPQLQQTKKASHAQQSQPQPTKHQNQQQFKSTHATQGDNIEKRLSQPQPAAAEHRHRHRSKPTSGERSSVENETEVESVRDVDHNRKQQTTTTTEPRKYEHRGNLKGKDETEQKRVKERKEEEDEDEEADDSVLETDNEAEWTHVVRCLLCDKRVVSMCFQCHCKSNGYILPNNSETEKNLNCHNHPCGKTLRKETPQSFVCADSNFNTLVGQQSEGVYTTLTARGRVKTGKEIKHVHEHNALPGCYDGPFSSNVESTEMIDLVQHELWSWKEQLHKRQEKDSKLLAIQEHLKGDADFDGEDSSLVYGQMEKNQQTIWNTSRSCQKALQNYRDFIERRRSKEQAIIDDGNVDMDVVEAWQKKHADRIKTLNNFEREYDKCEEWMRKLAMPLAPLAPASVMQPSVSATAKSTQRTQANQETERNVSTSVSSQ